MSAAAGVSFDKLCRVVALPAPTPEYAFAAHIGRRWRFDWAWPAQRVALEIDGGVFIGGRHSRGVGAIKDMEKLNTAAVEGWLVLRVIPADLHSTATLELIRRALTQRR